MILNLILAFKNNISLMIITKFFLIILLINSNLFAQDAIKRNGGSYVKTSLNAYSFNQLLIDNILSKDKGISLSELLVFCADNNFDAVDVTGYYFPGYPIVPSDKDINEFKRRAFELGLDISGTGVRTHFANSDSLKRTEDVKLVKEWIDVAVKLGAPVIRVFAGEIPLAYENRRNEVARYVTESLKECAEYGKQRGVIVGIQNHGDFLQTADQCIEIVKAVNSEWFGIIVDIGSFFTKDPYIDIEKVMPYAVNFQVKTSVFSPQGPMETDLPRLMKIINRSGYRGYLPIETLQIKGEAHQAYDPHTLVPAFLKEVKTAIKEEYK